MLSRPRRRRPPCPRPLSITAGAGSSVWRRSSVLIAITGTVQCRSSARWSCGRSSRRGVRSSEPTH